MQGEKRFIKVTEKEYEWLMKGWKTGKKSAFRQRCHYIILSHQGKTIQEITEIYQVTRQTVSTWFGKYEIAGISGLHSNKKTGRPAIIRVDNETEVIEIEKLVENSSQNLKPVLTAIKKKFGKTLSKRTLQRLLKKKDGAGNVSEKSVPKNQIPKSIKKNAKS